MATRRERERREIRYSDAKEVAAKQTSGFTPASLNLPKGLKLFKFEKAGIYRLDVIPYVVGKGNPACDEGMIHYERTYWVHRGVGPNNDTYCCPIKTFGEHRCPVCEHAQRLRQGGAAKEAHGPFWPRQRQLWLVVDVTRPDPDAGPEIKLFETSYKGGQGYKGWGELIDAKVKLAEPGEPATTFYYLGKEGATIKVSTAEKKYQVTYYVADEIEFVARKKGYDESILDEAPCLDDIPRRVSYDELAAAFQDGAAAARPAQPASQPPAEKAAEKATEKATEKAAEKAAENGRHGREEDEDGEDEAPRRPARPAREEKEEPKATAIKPGNKVLYRKKRWDVVRVKGGLLDLEDEDDGDVTERKVDPADVRLIEEDGEDD